MGIMRVRTALVIVLAAVFGVSAAAMVGLTLRQPAAVSNPETVSVVMVTTDVHRGSVVTLSELTTRECPKELVPPGAITQTEDAAGRVAVNTVTAFRVLVAGDLARQGGGRGLAPLIPSGMRAFTIQTANVSSSMAGFILPGNVVDILLTLTSPQDPHTGGMTTVTLLQGIEVLAVDQRIEAPADNKMDARELRSVTLLVMPEQASLLGLGQNRGTLHLSLRNPEDRSTPDTQPATLARLLPAPSPVPAIVPATKPSSPPAATPNIHVITIINGGTVRRHEIVLPDGPAGGPRERKEAEGEGKTHAGG